MSDPFIVNVGRHDKVTINIPHLSLSVGIYTRAHTGACLMSMAVDDYKYIYIRCFVLAVAFLAAAAVVPLPLRAAASADSLAISPVSPTVPRTYGELLGAPLPADLRLPRNVVSSVEYDAESGCYVLRTKVGDKDIATPFILTPSQYARWRERNERRQRFRTVSLACISLHLAKSDTLTSLA